MKKYFAWLSEFLVVFAAVLIINNYLGNQDVVIKADGKGYYDYLPATFIYQDLNFHFTDTLVTEYYDHKSYSSGYLKSINGHQVDKYFPGVAILWIPFFAGAHWYALNSEYPADGYSRPYQKSIFYAAIFYLWLGLLFLRKVLQRLRVQWYVILGVQLLFTLATPIMNYVQYDSSFTHVYSFALINGVVYLGFRFLDSRKWIDAIGLGVLIGLIIIVRPVNLMAILLLLLYFDSWNEFKKKWVELFSDEVKKLGVFCVVFLSVVSIVPVIWSVQTGQWFIWGYENEGFNFLKPAFIDFLFSYRKGAFVHTPLLFVVLLSGIYLYRKKAFKLGVFAGLIGLITYVLSSWWAWYYGASYGSRPMIDYYILFALAIALFIKELKPVWFQLSFLGSLFIFIPINIIQTFQYQTYIMDWNEMTLEKFQTIGLHIDEKYRGMYFRQEPDFNKDEIAFEYEKELINVKVLPHQIETVLEVNVNDSLERVSEINWVVVDADLTYQSGESKLVVEIKKQNGDIRYQYGYFIFGTLKKENIRGVGRYYYGVSNIEENDKVFVQVYGKEDEVDVHSIRIKLIAKK